MIFEILQKEGTILSFWPRGGFDKSAAGRRNSLLQATGFKTGGMNHASYAYTVNSCRKVREGKTLVAHCSSTPSVTATLPCSTPLLERLFDLRHVFLPCEKRGVEFGKGGLLEKGSFQKSPFSRDCREFGDSRGSKAPRLWKKKENPTIF